MIKAFLRLLAVITVSIGLCALVHYLSTQYPFTSLYLPYFMIGHCVALWLRPEEK